MASRYKFLRNNMFAIGIIVAVVAVLLVALLTPQPHQTTTNREAESASGNGQVIEDAEASNGSALQFGQ